MILTLKPHWTIVHNVLYLVYLLDQLSFKIRLGITEVIEKQKCD